MNILLELRETAKHCPNVLTAKLVKDAADDLDHALTELHENPMARTMIAVNGAWARAIRLLDQVPPIGGDGTTGGAMPVPEMRKAA